MTTLERQTKKVLKMVEKYLSWDLEKGPFKHFRLGSCTSLQSDLDPYCPLEVATGLEEAINPLRKDKILGQYKLKDPADDNFK